MSREFDPRFDPAFQPGFDPTVHGSRRRAVAPLDAGRRLAGRDTSGDSGDSGVSTGRESRASRTDSRNGLDELFAEPSGVGQTLSRTAGSDSGEAQFRQLPAEPREEQQPDESEPDPLARRNPYFPLLWLVSVGLIVLAVSVYWWSMNDDGQHSYQGNDVPLAIVLRQLVWVVAPALVTVGLSGCIGLLFWQAARWRPRDR